VSEQGLATLTHQIGITIGVPILSAIAATQALLLTGIHLALAVNVLVSLTVVTLVWTGLRPRPHAATDERDTGETNAGAPAQLS
jgi:hypothetical protein